MASRTLTPAERALLARQSYARMRERMLRVRRLAQTDGAQTSGKAVAADQPTAGTTPEHSGQPEPGGDLCHGMP